MFYVKDPLDLVKNPLIKKIREQNLVPTHINFRVFFDVSF